MDESNGLIMDAGFLALQRAGQEHSLRAASGKAQAKDISDDKLEGACKQFEALLLNMMIREMRKTVPDPALFPSTMAQEIFTGMLDEKTAGEMAENGGIGLQRMVFDRLKENQ